MTPRGPRGGGGRQAKREANGSPFGRRFLSLDFFKHRSRQMLCQIATLLSGSEAMNLRRLKWGDFDRRPLKHPESRQRVFVR